jgi:hypothetical protein
MEKHVTLLFQARRKPSLFFFPFEHFPLMAHAPTERTEPVEKKRRTGHGSAVAAAAAFLADTARDTSMAVAAAPLLQSIEMVSNTLLNDMLLTWAKNGDERYIQMALETHPYTIRGATLAGLATLVHSPVFELALAHRDPKEAPCSLPDGTFPMVPMCQPDVARNLMSMRRCGALLRLKTPKGKLYSLSTLVDEGANADDFAYPIGRRHCAYTWMERAAPRIQNDLAKWLQLDIIDHVVLPFLIAQCIVPDLPVEKQVQETHTDWDSELDLEEPTSPVPSPADPLLP